jgi:hypothetical protein
MKIDDEVVRSRLLGVGHIIRRQGGVKGDYYIMRR